MFNAQTLSEFETKLSKLTNPSNEVEVEAKFGFYRNKKFTSQVTFKHFNSLKNMLSDSRLPSTIEHTKDYRSKSGIRKQVISVAGEEDRVVWQRKSRLHDFDKITNKYGVRVSLNSEKTIESVDGFTYDVLRIRHRESFNRGGNIRIDMTEIDSQSTESRKRGGIERCSYQNKYEVEVEIINWHENIKEKLGEFNKVLKIVFKTLYDTENLYTTKERGELFSFMNERLGEDIKKPVLDFGMVAQARNLKFKDMVWGGLIGNRSGPYIVTHKADGIRKFLVTDRTGVWLVFPPKEANLIYRIGSGDLTIWNQFTGLILDGELVPKDRRRNPIVEEEGVEKEKGEEKEGVEEEMSKFPGVRLRKKELERFLGFPKAKYWFLVFDTLAINKDKDIQLRPHSVRMNKAYQEVNTMNLNRNSKKLLITFKSFREIKSPEQFYFVMQRMFSEKPILPYYEDGFIFMSGVAPYNPIRRLERIRNKKISLKERRLTSMPDICKWKPVERLTIDFSITHRLGGKVELLILKDRNKCVPFKGSNIIPFNYEDMVDHEHEMLNPEKYPTKTIIEFKWDFNQKRFVPVIPRLDKQKPNRMDVAIDDFELLFDPITQETLEGKNFRLMRKYHNRIKRDLFLKVKGEKYLLDIGSGRGGDIYSWKNFDKIVAVEPDNNHIIELTRRLEKQGIRDRVLIVQTGGEDSERITSAVKSFIGNKVDVVSMMFSLTFFWKNEEMLRSLVKTINSNLKDNGDIIFSTMDGDTVEEVYNPFFRGIPINKLVFIRDKEDRGFATLRIQPEDEIEEGQGRKAYVYIRDSIVGSREIERPESVLQLNYDLPVIYSPTRIISREEIKGDLLVEKETKNIEIEQEEYLVHLDDFERLLREIGRKEISKTIYRADHEHFLNEAEKRFSRFYSYGRYTISSGVDKGLSEEYALWKSVEKITNTLLEEYRSEEVLGAFKRFNLNNTKVFGDLTKVDRHSEKYGTIIEFFEKDLSKSKISKDIIVDIIDDIDAGYPLKLDISIEDVEIRRETDLPGLLKIGDSYFYMNSDRLDVLLEMGDLVEVAKIVLRNYASTLTPSSNLLPKNFLEKIRDMWPDDYLIEVETTPLTSKVLLLDGLRRRHYSSYFENEKDFGSIGLFENWTLFETPEETYTTMVVFKTSFEMNIEDSVEGYFGLLKSTPEEKHLRIILFLPTNTVESSERTYLHKNIVDSGFLSYEKSIEISTESYQVYVLETFPKNRIEDLTYLFENFQDYEQETPDMDQIKRFIPDGADFQVI